LSFFRQARRIWRARREHRGAYVTKRGANAPCLAEKILR